MLISTLTTMQTCLYFNSIVHPSALSLVHCLDNTCGLIGLMVSEHDLKLSGIMSDRPGSRV